MSNVTLEQLRVGIPLQCEILFEEDSFHAQVLFYRMDVEDDPVVSISTTKDALQNSSDQILAEVQNLLCDWLDKEGFAEYAFVLCNADNRGSFVVKLDPEVY